ncbi:oligosaccharide flippase family protein [Rubellimicrobium arenae]|uniref:oligosaccharide flippase family protein n=1 Tax=Rubellimicrobium arenae TaxID=2817372 RepID=UPI001B316A33|nr:oligosaccharide flippase family protein [Rubellimicrobium arenae]
MLRSALLILSGNALASVLLLVRNLLVARLIPVADYGVASTFAIAMAVIEMVSSIGLQQQIVQAKNGDDPHFQAALQGFQVFRGMMSSILLFLLAPFIADFMNVPQATWGHQVMAVVPLLNALTHFDIYRMNRRMVFGPMLIVGLVPALGSLLAVWPLAMWFGDWRALLWANLLQGVLGMLTSHVVAERRYRLAFDREIIRGSLSFGWPLLANNVLLFLVFNGDRIMVGRVLGMEALAIFSMGTTLTLTPTLVMAKSVQNFFLPRLSSAAHREGEGARRRFTELADATLQAGLLNGGVLVLATVLAGQPFVEFALGEKYAALVPLLGLMAVMQAARVFKSGSSVVALAVGRSGNAPLANLVRLVSLPLAWIALLQGYGLVTIIWIAILGESVGYIVSLYLVESRLAVSLRPLVPALLSTVLLLVVGTLPVLMPTLPVWVPAVAVVCAFALQLASMGALRSRLVAAFVKKSES